MIYAALVNLDKPKPAVYLLWKKTIRPEYLISLLDGKRYKMLRRHLLANGLTPEAYRERYDLPKDYPMMASAYREQRSALARESSLGRKRQGADDAAVVETGEAPGVVEPAAAAPTDEQASAAPAPRKRGAPTGKED